MEKEHTYTDLKKIQQMLKLIPNNFPISGDDLEQIFSQNETRQVAKRSIRDKG